MIRGGPQLADRKACHPANNRRHTHRLRSDNGRLVRRPDNIKGSKGSPGFGRRRLVGQTDSGIAHGRPVIYRRSRQRHPRVSRRFPEEKVVGVRRASFLHLDPQNHSAGRRDHGGIGHVITEPLQAHCPGRRIPVVQSKRNVRPGPIRTAIKRQSSQLVILRDIVQSHLGLDHPLCPRRQTRGNRGPRNGRIVSRGPHVRISCSRKIQLVVQRIKNNVAHRRPRHIQNNGRRQYVLLKRCHHRSGQRPSDKKATTKTP